MRTLLGERLKKNPAFEWEYNAVKHLKGARKSPIKGLRKYRDDVSFND